MESGVTVPPFHPNCRGTTVPVIDEEIWGVGERAARNEDGKVYTVPGDMTYEEWKAEQNKSTPEIAEMIEGSFGNRPSSGGEKTIRKSISLDDFDTLKELVGDEVNEIAKKEGKDIPKYHIPDEVIDVISKTLEEHDALNLFSGLSIKPLAGKKVFDTVFHQKGTWYTVELQINGLFFNDVSLEELQNIIKNNSVTVCKTLEDCIVHETYHAKSAQSVLAAVVDRWNEQKGFAEISKTAAKDMLEAIAEAGVLKEKGMYDTIPEEIRSQLDETAKELGIW